MKKTKNKLSAEQIKKMKYMTKLWATNEMSVNTFLPLTISAIGQVVCLIRLDFLSWFVYWFSWSIPFAVWFVWGFFRIPKTEAYIDYAKSFGDNIIDRAVGSLGRPVKLTEFDLMPIHTWDFILDYMEYDDLLKANRTELYTLRDSEYLKAPHCHITVSNAVQHSVVMVLDDYFYFYNEETVIAHVKPAHYNPKITKYRIPTKDIMLCNLINKSRVNKPICPALVVSFRLPEGGAQKLRPIPDYDIGQKGIRTIANFLFDNYVVSMQRNVDAFKHETNANVIEMLDETNKQNIKDFGIKAKFKMYHAEENYLEALERIKKEAHAVHWFKEGEPIIYEEMGMRRQLCDEYIERKMQELYDERPEIFPKVIN